MYRIASRAPLLRSSFNIAAVKSLPARPPCLTPRHFSTQHQQVKSRLPFKSISASVLLTSAMYMYSQGIAQAEAATAAATTGTSTPAITLSELQDKTNRIAVEAKSTEELAMALFVYRLCALPWLVDAAPYLIAASEKLHLQAPVYWFVKQTFFRHFCGGETPEECVSSMDKLAESGINCILDLSIEADLHLDNQAPQEGQSKYFRDEQQADIVTKMIKASIETAAQGAKNNAMVAVKVTAFSPPELLLRLNQSMAALDQSFLELQNNGHINAQGVRQVIDKIVPMAESQEQQKQRESIIAHLESKQATLDIIEFRKLFNLQGPGRDVWWKTTSNDAKSILLTAEDLEAYDRMIARLEQVAGLAKELKVGVMVDAEQSYFQDAIDHVAVNLQRKYNARTENQSQQPTIYNTYQMYTKSARGRLELDVELSMREDFTFAAKLVRGAYMVSERKRAEDMGYTSPICDTLEDTHASYNGGVKFLLNKLKEHQETTGETVNITNSPIVFMVASHNRDSIMLTIEEMEKNSVMPRSGVVLFGQLFGMQDQISYTLGRHGYAIYKYLPYGMIDEVIPYLLRRAQENSSVLGGVAVERQLMWQEVKDRLTGKAVSPDVSITTGTATSA
ncbi:FAD-linked oxidoreductase-like protein [Gilbertella persicaria]|uniref:FAD-linked oxidoreductase-like protein n=1 Tax=Gilbertella persicaria TaxID=101096 RepID=UPI00221F1BCD|nr:FAD-linked oxidoreductase-like protein [Gilbertella persicaria]KAI8081914.1 FAD-linked oxidoreductase-like protein [Gilbertella persicaria]